MFPSTEPAARTGTGPAAPVASATRKSTGPDFLTRYRAFCYRVLGERLDRRSTNVFLAEKLRQAGLNVSPGLHMAVQTMTTLFATVGGFAVSFILFFVLLHPPLWYGYVLMITAIAGGGTAAGFSFVISSRISNRAFKLDRELPFTLSELSVLASTGMSPIELVRRMARRKHDAAMTFEFQKVVYKADIQGKDLITALAETAKESPSNTLREAFWDLANMIHQGGNLDEYLRNKSDDVFKMKRIVQKEFIERLQTFVDMYISLVLVGVLMIAVAAFLLNAFQSTAAGLDSNELLLVLTYGIVPLAVIVTSIMISIAYARSE